MKPWLLEILACPMDKHYPLLLTIFEIENLDEIIKEFDDVEKMAEELSYFFVKESEDNEDPAKTEVIILETADNELLVHDTLVRDAVPAKLYLEKIINSLDELAPIKDFSHEKVEATLKILLDFRKEVKDHLAKLSENVEEQKKSIEDLKDNLILLNWFKQIIEIESGIMFCTKCKRWYPIQETIPRMLPDELRNEKSDIEFLEKWKEKIDDEIKKEGLPAHL
ncbi:MAG: Trm112 family protein [Promethearchaeota archaeon]